jgi:hypothetical protein
LGAVIAIVTYTINGATSSIDELSAITIDQLSASTIMAIAIDQMVLRGLPHQPFL